MKKKQPKKNGRPALDKSGAIKVSVLVPLDRWHEIMALSLASGDKSAASTIRKLLLDGLKKSWQ